MLTATVDASGLERRATALAARLAPALKEAADAMQQAMAEELRAAMKSAGLKRRSGTLEDATRKGNPGNVAEQVIDIGGLRLVTGISGERVPYWRIQDAGGVILPRRAKMLAIPIHDEARAMYERAGGNGLRSLGDIFFVMRDGPNLYLAEKETGRPFFSLRRSVTIPAHPYIDPAVERYRAQRAPAIGERFRADAAAIWSAI